MSKKANSEQRTANSKQRCNINARLSSNTRVILSRAESAPEWGFEIKFEHSHVKGGMRGPGTSLERDG